MKIAEIIHPDYLNACADWVLYRDVFQGGRDFINKYLQKYSTRETQEDFDIRKGISYCPAHAKAAIIEIKNAIFQRMKDISRVGGTVTYRTAIEGEAGGVDLQGNSMNGFLGKFVLPELLVTGKVGIYIDRPPLPENATRADELELAPYIYIFKAEDILSWRYDKQHILTDVILREQVPAVDMESQLLTQWKKQYRLLNLTPEGVKVTKYNAEGVVEGEPVILKLKRIPFIIAELTHSLLEDVASYQVALLNVSSSDIHFICTANFPFYTEQYDMQAEASAKFATQVATTGLTPEQAAAAVDNAAKKTIEVGTVHGRRYPKNTDRPDFISPPSEPLKISIEKQNQMKDEIRQLVQLAIASLTAKTQSADSKAADNQGLENGLSYIGLELNYLEQEIAKVWAEYEGTDNVANITYPETYSLHSDAGKQNEEDYKNIDRSTSMTFKRVMAKRVADRCVGNYVSADVLQNIHDEIDEAEVIVGDPEIIKSDVELGLVSNATASKARGYPAGEVKKAEADHAARVARIAKAQAEANPAARGTPDLAGGSKTDAEKKSSQGADLNPNGTPKTRGKGE